MNVIRESDDLVQLGNQGGEHLVLLRALVQNGATPELATLKAAVLATRGLRGSASLLGLDAFQGFLGRLFALLEDLESGAEPWSARVEALLRDVETAEAQFLAGLERGEPEAGVTAVTRAETRLATWRRVLAPDTNESPTPAQAAATIAAHLTQDIEATVQQIARLRRALEASGISATVQDGVATLEREIAALQAALHQPRSESVSGPGAPQEGLRNHCEGALHHLVEAAAQEVLDEARERGLRLGLRVTGALDPIDDDLGAALLELLSLLWSDCLEVQATRPAAQIDTVLRSAEQRLIVEVRDDGMGRDEWRAARSDDDVLGFYPGLRRSRPLVESVHGLVEVEPRDSSGCRFRLSLPLSTERPHACLLRVGQHDVAVPASAVEHVFAAREVRIAQDAAGTFVELEDARVPLMHLAFILADVGYDELQRQNVVVVGSFERRAALFASDALRTVVGPLTGEAQGLWAGTLDAGHGSFPMLHVGALLGRCAPPEVGTRPGVPVPEVPAGSGREALRVLVVDSAVLERERLRELLEEGRHTVHMAQTAEEAWQALESQTVDLMLCDLRLPEMNAQQIADRRRQSGRHARVPMVLILAHAGEQSHLVVQQLGATAWVRSPIDRDDLTGILEKQPSRKVS